MYSMFFNIGVSELPQIYYSVRCTCTRRSPLVFGCSESGDVTTNFLLLQYRVQCLHVITRKKIFSSCRPNLFQAEKNVWEGWRISWQRRNTFTERFQRCITIIVRVSLPSNASKVCKVTLGTILHHDLQFTSGTRNFSSAERPLKIVTVVANLWPLLSNKTWPRWSVWPKKTHG